MPSKLEHEWDISPKTALQLQHTLQGSVHVEPLPLGKVKRVAGLDASYHKGKIYAVVVVLELPALDLVEQAAVKLPITFPYLPGLLSFREAPGLLSAVGELSNTPDVFIVDGHGLAHPRRFGLASHLGVLLDLPTVGCAKSLLVGKSPPPPAAAGSYTALTHSGQVVGVALRTRTGVKPVYVSIGHRVDLDSAIGLILACIKGYRLPEPIRWAHTLAGESQKSI
jgi:deoxyribonuclease V